METNPSTGSNSAASPSPSPCRWYQFGLCWRGDSCTSSHGSSTRSEPTASTSALPLKSATPPPPAEDEELTCAICFEVPETWGLLDTCSHPFCLTCIGMWRTSKERTPLQVVAGKTCPTCRRATGLVTPSPVFWKDGTEKQEAMKAHRDALAATPCRHFLSSPIARRWCPYGSDCLYVHALPSGEHYTFSHTHADTLATAVRQLEEARVREQLMEVMRGTSGVEARRLQAAFETMMGSAVGAPWEDEEDADAWGEDESDEEESDEEESAEDWEDEEDEEEADDEDDDPPETPLDPGPYRPNDFPPAAPTPNRQPRDPSDRAPAVDNPLRRPRHPSTLGAARRERERLAADEDLMPPLEDIEEDPVVPAASASRTREESDGEMPELEDVDEEVAGGSEGSARESERRDEIHRLQVETDSEEDSEDEVDLDSEEDSEQDSEDDDEDLDEDDEASDDSLSSLSSRLRGELADLMRRQAAGSDLEDADESSEEEGEEETESEEEEMPALVEVAVAPPVPVEEEEEEEEGSEGEEGAFGPSAEMREERARAADRRAVEARWEDVD